jgi:hypothetical protein
VGKKKTVDDKHHIDDTTKKSTPNYGVHKFASSMREFFTSYDSAV